MRIFEAAQNGGHTELLVQLDGDAVAGFTGTISLGVAVGTVSSG